MTSSEGRKRLERTLASYPFTDRDSVYQMVHDQLVKSSIDSRHGQKRSVSNNMDEIVQTRCAQVLDFLDLLRSASGEETLNLTLSQDQDNSTKGWKLKEDTGQIRVMYREGPVGTPFHTLLAEGIIYSPVVSSLCLAWEAPFYPLWWPQFTVPTFKIVESRWVKRIRIGEDLSLVRIKVPWPVAQREVLMCAFELEYFEEELIIVLINSVPTSEKIDERVHGFKAVDMPDASANAVRMELTGGFALQKITEDRSYFRTIANLDIKLDLVPPWLINFISRQLIGHGFKLYQKTLIAISNDERNSKMFREVMESQPMYARIQAGLQSSDDNRMSSLREAGKKSRARNINTLNVLHPNSQDQGMAIKVTQQEGIMHEMVGKESKDGKPSTSEIRCELPSQMLASHLPGESSEQNERSVLKDTEVVGQNALDSGVQIDPEVKTALQLLESMISFVHTFTAHMNRESPSAELLENGTQLSQALDSFPDASCNSRSPDDVERSAIGSEKQESSTKPLRSDKEEQKLNSMDEPQENDVCNGDTDIYKARKPKRKRNKSCLSFLSLCKG